MPEGEAFLIGDVELRFFAIEVHLNDGAVVVDDVIGVEIGAGSLGEDPRVVDWKLGIGGVVGIGRALDDQVAVVHEDLLDIAVLHQRVFVDEDRLGQHVPVYLVDTVFVGHSDDELILVVVTVNCELGESEVPVPAGDLYSLRLQDIDPEESGIVVQEEDIIEVDLCVHYPECLEVEEGAIDDSQRLYFGGILDRDDEDLHVGVVAVCGVHSVCEVRPQEVGKPSGLRMAELH